MKLEYIHSRSADETARLVKADENEFIEGIQFDLKNAIVMYGNFADHAPPDKVKVFIDER